MNVVAVGTRIGLVLCAFGMWWASCLPLGVAAQEPAGYQNLQVLPADISRDQLIGVMLDNLAGLGLPRRANEGCLFCHVGSMDVPSSEWDWASDDNPMKHKARVMMAMVRDINRSLAEIDRSFEAPVGCYACHAARTNPMPLEQVLLGERERGGVDALVRAYRELRSRYFAADAYDFRTGTLTRVAEALAQRGLADEAVRVHELNIEATDDPEARRALVRMRMRLALEEGGVDAMFAAYGAAEAEHPEPVFTHGLLSPLAWTLFRAGAREAGFRLFELNFERHPDSYFATEDLAWGSESMGDHERAIELAEAWLRAHPGHELGLRLLQDLRREERN